VPQVVVTGHIGEGTEALLLAQVRGAKSRSRCASRWRTTRWWRRRRRPLARRALRAAAHAGLPLDAQAPLWPLEREAVLEAVELDLLRPRPCSCQLSGGAGVGHFRDRHGRRPRAAPGRQRADGDGLASSSIDADTLVGWLDQSLFKPLAD
jgi:type III restriction enzyme